MKEIISALEKEGLGPEQCSSEEVVRVLFTRQKDLAEKLKETEDVLSACKNGDPRPIIQVSMKHGLCSCIHSNQTLMNVIPLSKI